MKKHGEEEGIGQGFWGISRKASGQNIEEEEEEGMGDNDGGREIKK